MISVTDKAADHIKSQLSQRGKGRYKTRCKDNWMLWIGIRH